MAKKFPFNVKTCIYVKTKNFTKVKCQYPQFVTQRIRQQENLEA